MLFDEPELGLHPYALTLLAALFRQATHAVSSRRAAQVIVSTQSAALLDELRRRMWLWLSVARGSELDALRRSTSRVASGI